MYDLLFEDATTKLSKDVYFIASNNDIENLYQLIKSLFLKENTGKDKSRVVKLGNEQITLFSIKASWAFFMAENGTFNMTEKQVDKLFGKRK